MTKDSAGASELSGIHSSPQEGYMKGIREWSNGLMFVVGLWVVALPTGGGDTAAVAAGPPSNHNPHDVFLDPTPIWDKILPTAERFVILSAFGGAAVRDNETGLVWEKNPAARQGATSYLDAIVLCQVAAKTGGRMGWRLPTLPELSSLADGTNATPGTLSLPPGHPFSNVTTSTGFLTFGTLETSPAIFETTVIKFTPGGPGGVLPIDSQFAPKLGLAVGTAWCVRSGNPVQPQ